MGGSVADIAIKVIANANGVGPGLDKAERELLRFDQEARRIGASGSGISSVTKALGALGAAGALYTVAGGIRETINRLDDIGDYADGIGDTAANLSRLHFAAEQLGSSAGAVDSAMAKMAKSIGTAAIEGGDAKDSIESIGLSVENLQKMRPSEAFIAITNALSDLPTVYEKAAVASKIFGKGAIEIISILKAGKGEIAEYGKRLDDIGGTVTQDQIDGAAKLKDTLVELDAQWKGVKNESVKTFGPALIRMLKIAQAEMTGLWFAGAALKSVFSRGAIENPFDFTQKKSTAAETSKDLESKLQETEERSKQLDDLAKKTLEDIKTAEMAFDEKEQRIWELFESGRITHSQYAAAADKYLQEMDAGIKARNDMLDRVQEMERGNADIDGEMAKAYGRLGKGGMDEANKKTKKLKGDVSRQLRDMGAAIAASVETPVERFEKRISEITQAFNAGAISADIYARAFAKAWGEMQQTMAGDRAELGYTNIGASGPIGGDMPGMSSEAYDRFMQYNTLPGGFVGDSIPDNMRTFTPPEWGSRQVDFRSNYSSFMGGGDDGMGRNNQLLERIADGVEGIGIVG